MRVVHLTSVHPWNDNRIFNKMCRSLALAGHDVHLVAVMDKMQHGTIVDGVTLHPICSPRNRCERFLITTPTVLSEALRINGDLYHFHDPEILPYIVRARSEISKPIIYDIHEDYPAAMLRKHWMPKLFRPLMSYFTDLFERKGVARIDGLIAAWPKIYERFEGHPRRIIINNYPYASELRKNQVPGMTGRTGYFAYVGVLSKARGILEMIRATDIGGIGYRLMLAGNWSPLEFEKECRAERGWRNCEYKGYLTRKDIRDLFASVQAGLIAFHPEPNHLYSVPNKIFEYISAGLPVIASDLPMQREIVEKFGCGLIADPTSPNSIHEKMRWIHEHPNEAIEMGAAGRRAVKDKLNWENEFSKLIEFYRVIST
jgi:glycosyltransferase involved in cell wall biosynthesis